MAWHFTHTRCGGRCRVPHAWHLLPIKAYFQPSDRRAAGESGACGSGRRGGSRLRKPRHVRTVAYDTGAPSFTCWATVRMGFWPVIADVVRQMMTSAPSASETTMMS